MIINALFAHMVGEKYIQLDYMMIYITKNYTWQKSSDNGFILHDIFLQYVISNALWLNFLAIISYLDKCHRQMQYVRNVMKSSGRKILFPAEGILLFL